jgi:hypothetical protein
MFSPLFLLGFVSGKDVQVCYGEGTADMLGCLPLPTVISHFWGRHRRYDSLLLLPLLFHISVLTYPHACELCPHLTPAPAPSAPLAAAVWKCARCLYA